LPRLVKALVGKKVTSAGCMHTDAWTEAGELFTVGRGGDGQLGHGGIQNELLVPRLVEALMEACNEAIMEYGLVRTRGALTAKINQRIKLRAN